MGPRAATFDLISQTERMEAGRLGTLAEFERFESSPHYKRARKSWEKGWAEVFRKQGAEGFMMEELTNELESCKSFARAYQGTELKEGSRADLNLKKIEEVLDRQEDKTHRQEMARERVKRRRRKPKASAESQLVVYWFSGGLWWMDDATRALTIQKITGERYASSTIKRARLRSGLIGWERLALALPPIDDYNQNTKQFKFNVQ